MKSFILLCFFAVMISFCACKSNTAEQQDEATVTIADTNTANTQSSSTASGGHEYAYLTDKMLHYQVANTAGKDATHNEYENQWIDLDPDGTFKAGVLSEQTHTGKWDYNHDARVLLLRPDDPKFKISEWNVMHNEDMVIFVGTQTYGNNSTQIKLVRSDKFPEKK